ncbi:histidine--tRNA ligase, partial [bacterium]|nr:histidine--tRNA ligase [bacterium]
MDIASLRGTYDIFPPQSRIWESVELEARRIFNVYGCSEIRTPIIEDTRLFTRSIGEGTDIVNKEMYTFPDRKGRSITLRPEGTASVVRAYLQHSLYKDQGLCRFFYIGPMFRYERPQAGRNRQFYQLGTEFLGSTHPYYDAELISLANEILNQLNLSEKHTLEINSLGDLESRATYKTQLVEYFNDFKEQLSEDSQKRLSLNPLRILDSKDEGDKKLIQQAPLLKDSLSSRSKESFDWVLEKLQALNIPFKQNPYLVRGLDYYNDCIFEFTVENFGAQNTLLAGGRYDQLI